MRYQCLIGLTLASVYTMTCQGQYRVLPGKTDPGDFKDCFPKTPARICLEAAGEAHCYSPPNDKFDPPSNEAYIFGLEPKAKAVGRLDGKELTLFTAMFSGCGSGTLTYFSLLAVRDSEFVNLLPKVELTNQSEYKLWSLPHYSSLPVLVTADFIWDYKAMEKSNYSEKTRLCAPAIQDQSVCLRREERPIHPEGSLRDNEEVSRLRRRG